MLKRSPLVAFALVVIVLLACKKKETNVITTTAEPLPTAATTTVTPATTPSGKGDLAEARALLEKFLAPGADTRALTLDLKPEPADYVAVFGAADANDAVDYYTKMWKDPKADIKPNAGQTELLVFGTTTDKVASDGDFPGGYSKVKLQKGLPIYRWKFVKPGATLGMAFDGLIFVNGHFAFFPKPWRINEK